MNANELMIGDWITHPGRITPAKVVGIDPSYQYIDIDNGDAVIPLALEFVKPIPITTEFIEMNGYTFCPEVENVGDWEFHGLYKSCFYRIPGDMWHLWILVGELDGGNQVSINIRYVHEFQHAMRICGIENEIVLPN